MLTLESMLTVDFEGVSGTVIMCYCKVQLATTEMGILCSHGGTFGVAAV